MSKWYKVVPVDLSGNSITVTGGALVVTGADEELVMDVASSTVTYLGNAVIPSPTSAAAWKIKKLTSNASGNLISITYAGGSPAYTNIWDDRSSLSYS